MRSALTIQTPREEASRRLTCLPGPTLNHDIIGTHQALEEKPLVILPLVPMRLCPTLFFEFLEFLMVSVDYPSRKSLLRGDVRLDGSSELIAP